MLQIVQLQDGCYLVILDYTMGEARLHREWTFRVAESDAEPSKNGECIIIRFQ